MSSASPEVSSKTFESIAVTRGVRVRARPFYVPDQSDPEDAKYLFAYQITISNESEIPVQLLSRHWIIIDGDGRVHHVNYGLADESKLNWQLKQILDSDQSPAAGIRSTQSTGL